MYKVEMYYDKDSGRWVVSLGGNGYRDVFATNYRIEADGVYEFLNASDPEVQEAVWNQAGNHVLVHLDEGE